MGCFAFSCFFSFVAFAQNPLAGRWVGKITQTGADKVASAYYFEFTLLPTSALQTWTGSTYSHLHKADGKYLLKSSLQAAWKAEENKLYFQETTLIAYENTILKKADFCVKNGVLELITHDQTHTLTGEWTGKENKTQNPCTGGKIMLTKVLPDTTAAVQFAEEKPSTLQNRTIKKGKTITVKHTRLKIDFFDDAEEDGDVVSVNFNGKWLFRSHKLRNNAKTVYLNLDPNNPYNFIATFAHNLGNIPPNTTALLIDDGKRKQKIVLKSDEQESDVLYFEYENQ